MDEIPEKIMIDKQVEAKILFNNIKESLPQLMYMLKSLKSNNVYEDTMYDFYHKEKRLLRLNDHIFMIVLYLESLQPDTGFTNKFFDIIKCAISNKSKAQINKSEESSTKPIVEAFIHVKYLLEVVVKSGEMLDCFPDDKAPDYWSSVLSIYNLK